MCGIALYLEKLIENIAKDKQKMQGHRIPIL